MKISVRIGIGPAPTARSPYASAFDLTTVTVSPKIQVVIPQDVRRRWKLQPGARLQIIEFSGCVRLVPEVAPASLRGIARGMDTSPARDPNRGL